MKQDEAPHFDDENIWYFRVKDYTKEVALKLASYKERLGTNKLKINKIHFRWLPSPAEEDRDYLDLVDGEGAYIYTNYGGRGAIAFWEVERIDRR